VWVWYEQIEIKSMKMMFHNDEEKFYTLAMFGLSPRSDSPPLRYHKPHYLRRFHLHIIRARLGNLGTVLQKRH
jgi:hypothetical protein